MASSGLRLPRSRSIKCRRDFNAVRTRGRRLPASLLLINWMAVAPENPSRLGIVASRKIGNAVVRNRARRRLRESFRRHQHDLVHPIDLVLVARPAIAGKGYAVIEEHLLSVLRRAGLLKEGR